ncbi:MAG TPA: hypothetical protein VF813_12535, partial [Anaerolineaceae bacterium]
MSIRNKKPFFILALLLVALVACFPGSNSASGITILPALKSAGLQGSLQGSLQGGLVFVEFGQHGSRLLRLDLASGKLQALFSAPDRSWLASAAVAPDGKTILIAYAPPPPKSQVQLSNTDLYTLPMDGSGAPTLLLEHKAVNESYFTPTWSPDGQYIYYTHNIPNASARTGVDSVIERMRMPGAPGTAQVVARNSIWPALSPDGTRLAYLTLSAYTSVDRLTLASADGSNPVEGLPATQVNTVDAHFYAPDGKTIYYSTINETSATPATAAPAPQGLLAPFLFGPRPVQAHNIPSDWFRVTLDGQQQITQVTTLHNTQLAGSFSPDGQWIAFIS